MTMLTWVAMIAREAVMADLNAEGMTATGMACPIDTTIGRTIPIVIDQSAISGDFSSLCMTPNIQGETPPINYFSNSITEKSQG